MSAIASTGTAARYALGGIRVLNGTLGLLAPAVIIRRFGDRNPQANPAAFYGVRLFGVRTIVLGADLLLLRGRELDGALRSAVADPRQRHRDGAGRCSGASSSPGAGPSARADLRAQHRAGGDRVPRRGGRPAT